jgi:hypothetical protein
VQDDGESRDGKVEEGTGLAKDYIIANLVASNGTGARSGKAHPLGKLNIDLVTVV